MESFMTVILKYLKQATTWAGITAMLTAFGVAISPELAVEITSAGMGIAGLILVVYNENKADE